jgi:alpha-1,6-mannosyltransferase
VVQRLWVGQRKSAARRLLLVAAGAALAAGAGLTALTAAASRHNYPGGTALRQLHSLAAGDAAAAAAGGRQLRVHIGVLPAMTGVSRFGEAGSPWVYSKAEGLSPQLLSKQQFDFLLTDQETVEGYRQLAAVHGFQRLQLSSRSPMRALRGLLQGQLPVRVVTAPQVFIQRRLGI